MEPNSFRRNKFNIYSTKEPVNSWLKNPSITEYMKSAKTVIFDRVLPDDKNHHTDTLTS